MSNEPCSHSDALRVADNDATERLVCFDCHAVSVDDESWAIRRGARMDLGSGVCVSLRWLEAAKARAWNDPYCGL